MMWRLKDKDLETALERMSGGRFVAALNDSMQAQPILMRGYVFVEFSRVVPDNDWAFKDNVLYFHESEIFEVPEYNPRAWNKYPDIKPPYDLVMRVETRDGHKMGAIYHLFGEGPEWCAPSGTLMPKALSESVIRFRPWED